MEQDVKKKKKKSNGKIFYQLAVWFMLIIMVLGVIASFIAIAISA